MSEYQSKKDHSHLRADVPKRRMGYWAFLWTAVVVFIVSLVDIIFLDEVLFWGVIAAYVILLIWGITLLFSRSIGGEEPDEFFGVVAEDDADWTRDGKVEHLRCTNCAHVFGFDMKHLDDDKAHVAFNCPECGATGKLPARNATPVEAVVPGGRMHGPKFHCNECAEEWSVGAIGHEPKAEVRFDACPHCQSMNIGRA